MFCRSRDGSLLQQDLHDPKWRATLPDVIVTYLRSRVAVRATPHVDEIDQKPYPVDPLTALVDSVPLDAVQSDVVERPHRHQSDGADNVRQPGSEPVPILGARRQDEVRAQVRRSSPQQQIGPDENDEQDVFEQQPTRRQPIQRSRNGRRWPLEGEGREDDSETGDQAGDVRPEMAVGEDEGV